MPHRWDRPAPHSGGSARACSLYPATKLDLARRRHGSCIGNGRPGFTRSTFPSHRHPRNPMQNLLKILLIAAVALGWVALQAGYT